MNASHKDAKENKDDKNLEESILQQSSNVITPTSPPSIVSTLHVSGTQKEMQSNAQLTIEDPAHRKFLEEELLRGDEAPLLHPNTVRSFQPTTKSTIQQSVDTTEDVSGPYANVVETHTTYSATHPSNLETTASNVSMSASTSKTARAACIECRKSHQKCQPADRETLLALKKDPDSNICKRCCSLGLTCTYVEAKKRGRKERPKNVVSAMTNTFVSSSGEISITTQNLLKEEGVEIDTKLSDSSRNVEVTSLTPQQDLMQPMPKRRRQSIPTVSTNVKGSSTTESSSVTSPISPHVFSQATDIIHPEKFGKRTATMDTSTIISSTSPISSIPRPQPVHGSPFHPFPGFPPQQHQPPFPQQSLPPQYPYSYPPYQQVAYPPAAYIPPPVVSKSVHPTPITVPVMANNPSLSSSSTIHPTFQQHSPPSTYAQQNVYSAPRLESVALPPIQHMVDSVEATQREEEAANIENKKGKK